MGSPLPIHRDRTLGTLDLLRHLSALKTPTGVRWGEKAGLRRSRLGRCKRAGRMESGQTTYPRKGDRPWTSLTDRPSL
jgi:hypothetical protein